MPHALAVQHLTGQLAVTGVPARASSLPQVVDELV